ncbi:MAG: heme o synthase, partial [Candidatus Hodarchaeales archaeon]
FISAKGNVTILQLLIAGISGYLTIGGSHLVNAYIDRQTDQIMLRTKHRPIASGRINPPEFAILIGIIMVISGSILAGLVFNILTGLLVLSGALYYILVYSLALKYRTSWSTFFGGIAGSFPILVGSAAANGSITLNGWLLAGVLFIWQPSHFWCLAVYLKEDYIKGNIPILPVVIGNKLTSRVILISVIFLMLFVWLFPILGETSLIFGILSTVLSFWLIIVTLRLYRSNQFQSKGSSEYKELALKAFNAHNIYLGVLSLMLVLDTIVFYPNKIFFL